MILQKKYFFEIAKIYIDPISNIDNTEPNGPGPAIFLADQNIFILMCLSL